MQRALAALIFLPTPVLAQGILDGTWKVDITTQRYVGPPDVVVLTEAMFRCNSCKPPYTVKSDGKPHAIAGHPFYDAFAISIVDAHTAHDTGFRAGKVVFEDRLTVSADGNTLTDMSTTMAANNTAPATITYTSTRVGAGPPGAHAYSGSWQSGATTDASSNATSIVMKQRGQVFSEISMTGQSYTATLGGPPGKLTGNPNVTSVSIRQTGARTFQETGYLDGKVASVVTLRVSQDGRMMDVVYDDKRYGGVTRWTQTKQ